MKCDIQTVFNVYLEILTGKLYKCLWFPRYTIMYPFCLRIIDNF